MSDEAVLSVTIPERPGAVYFRSGHGKRNVTEFNYRYETAAAARLCGADGDAG